MSIAMPVGLYADWTVVRSTEIPGVAVLHEKRRNRCSYCGRTWDREKRDSCPGCGAHDDEEG